jgi:hypothetical protein
MLASDALLRIRNRIRDPGSLVFQDAELLQYYSDAQAIVAAKLIENRDQNMKKTLTVTASPAVAVPADFYGWVGEVPITISGANFALPSGMTTITEDYWVWPARISATGSTLPLTDATIEIIIHKAVEICLDKIGFDSAADANHTNAILGSRTAFTGTSQQARSMGAGSNANSE